MRPLSVMLISAHEWGWKDLRRVPVKMPTLEIAGDVATSDEAIRIAATLQPDAIISGSKLNGTPTRALLLHLQRNICPAAIVIRFSSSVDPDEEIALDDLRVAGHLLWNELTPERLERCLEALVSGEVVLGAVDSLRRSSSVSLVPATGT